MITDNILDVPLTGDKGWLCPKCGSAHPPSLTSCPNAAVTPSIPHYPGENPVPYYPYPTSTPVEKPHWEYNSIADPVKYESNSHIETYLTHGKTLLNESTSSDS